VHSGPLPSGRLGAFGCLHHPVTSRHIFDGDHRCSDRADIACRPRALMPVGDIASRFLRNQSLRADPSPDAGSDHLVVTVEACCRFKIAVRKKAHIPCGRQNQRFTCINLFRPDGKRQASKFLGRCREYESSRSRLTRSSWMFAIAIAAIDERQLSKVLRRCRNGALSEPGSSTTVRLVSGITWHRWVA
jgi:hypothetical protein